MAWLTRNDEVLAALGTDRAGLAGLGGDVQGALLLRGPTVVHTLRVPGPLDVAWCRAPGPLDGTRGRAPGPPDVAPRRAPPEELEVRRIATLVAHRVGRPCGRGTAVLVAEAGAFERWQLRVADRLEVRGG